MKSKMVEIELWSYEFEALKANRMINDICKDYLASPEVRGDFVVLKIPRYSAEDLAGWTAAEANHAKTEEEKYILNSACDSIEAGI